MAAGAAESARIAREITREGAIRDTVARYAVAPRADRLYVAIKLRVDPVLARLTELGPLGDVLDLGAGRGQLGLCLLALGRLQRLSGFDFDARKVEVARLAARGQARFELADVREHALESADSVLLVDVLHYLAPSEQDALLARAAGALRPGGRLVIRELGDRSGLERALTRAAERVAVGFGYNRASGRLGFRPLAEIEGRLRELGLAVDTVEASAGTPFENRLVVGRRASS